MPRSPRRPRPQAIPTPRSPPRPAASRIHRPTRIQQRKSQPLPQSRASKQLKSEAIIAVALLAVVEPEQAAGFCTASIISATFSRSTKPSRRPIRSRPLRKWRSASAVRNQRLPVSVPAPPQADAREACARNRQAPDSNSTNRSTASFNPAATNTTTPPAAKPAKSTPPAALQLPRPPIPTNSIPTPTANSKIELSHMPTAYRSRGDE